MLTAFTVFLAGMSMMIAAVIFAAISIPNLLNGLHHERSTKSSDESFIPGTKCFDAPFLYATTHHEVQNIMKYSRNGCLLSSSVLKGKKLLDEHVVELRSIAIGSYEKMENVLFVSDACSGDSFVDIYSNCNFDGKREYMKTVVSTDMNGGADHAYGICFDQDGNVYVSFQHTDCVLRFYKNTFEPMPIAPALLSDRKYSSNKLYG